MRQRFSRTRWGVPHTPDLQTGLVLFFTMPVLVLRMAAQFCTSE